MLHDTHSNHSTTVPPLCMPTWDYVRPSLQPTRTAYSVMSTTAIGKTGQHKGRSSSHNISAPCIFNLTRSWSSSSFRKVELTQCRLDTAQSLYSPVAIISTVCFNIQTPWFLPIQGIYVFHMFRAINGLFLSDRL
jgi:hypothetical protein